MAPGEATFIALAQAISSLGIPFNTRMNRTVKRFVNPLINLSAMILRTMLGNIGFVNNYAGYIFVSPKGGLLCPSGKLTDLAHRRAHVQISVTSLDIFFESYRLPSVCHCDFGS